MFKFALAFGAGVAAGLWIAKQYAKGEVHDKVHETLDSVGLGGGKIEELAQDLIQTKVFSD